MKTFDVKAHWDATAKVWWADSDEIPGLGIEAETFEELDEIVRVVGSDLLRLNLGFDRLFGINLIKEHA
jgi:hypothetical protein